MFQNCFDRVHVLGSKLIDLLASFIGSLGRPQKLRSESCLQRRGQILGVFGSVSAFGGEQRAAEKQFTAEFLSAAKRLAESQHEIQLITDAANGSDAAVEIGLQCSFDECIGIEFGPVVQKTAGSAQVHVHVDQSGEHRFTGGVERLRP